MAYDSVPTTGTKEPNMYVALGLQILGGSLVFVLVFLPAALLDVMINWLSASHTVSHTLLAVMKGAKLVLLALDCVIAGVFLASHVFRFFVLAWKDVRCALK